MPTDTIDRARKLIQDRLAELETEARKLESALANLREGTGRRRPSQAPKRRAAKSASKRRGAKANKRAPRGARREQLLAAVKANPGGRPAQLAREIGISANQVHALIAKARKDKLLVKRGQGYALKG